MLNIFFSTKVKAKTTIKLVENNEMIDDEIEIAKLFNKYFVNFVKKFGIFSKEQSAVSTENSLSEVKIAIPKYRNNPITNEVTERMEKLVIVHSASISLSMRKQ